MSARIMVTLLRVNQACDWLLPGSPENQQLLHSERSDRVFVCPPSLGHGYCQEIPLRDDLMLVIIDHTFNQDCVIDAIGEGNRIEFAFHLTDRHAAFSRFVPHFRLRQLVWLRAKRRIFNVEVFFKRPTLINYVQFFIERLSPQAKLAAEHILQALYRHQVGDSSKSITEMLSCIFDPIATQDGSDIIAAERVFSLEHILTDALFEESAALSCAVRSPIIPAMEPILGQILSCPYQGMTRRTYLTRKALKLVDLRLNAMLQAPFNDVRMRCISQAATLLRTQMTQPPSLEALARQVGTNRFTLTQGFHRLYGTTPFGYLRAHRLAQARRLLMTSDLSVTEVAAAVGYTSPNRFATAFRQQNGLNPKAFQMQVRQ